MLRCPKYATDIRKSSQTLFRQGGSISHSGIKRSSVMAPGKRCFQIRQHFLISLTIKCLGKEPRKKVIIFNKFIKKKRKSINEH